MSRGWLAGWLAGWLGAKDGPEARWCLGAERQITLFAAAARSLPKFARGIIAEFLCLSRRMIF